MIFDYQQASLSLEQVINFPNFPFANIANNVIQENPSIVGNSLGTNISIGGTISNLGQPGEI